MECSAQTVWFEVIRDCTGQRSKARGSWTKVSMRWRSSSWLLEKRWTGSSSEFIEDSQFGGRSCCVGQGFVDENRSRSCFDTCKRTRNTTSPVWPNVAVARDRAPGGNPFLLSRCRARGFCAQCFRVLLLRRLWCPLPLSSAFRRCGQPLDPRGHHRAACVTSGVLGRRGHPLESCASRVCREAGARVSTNLRVQDLDLLPGVQVDNHRLEVVALADGELPSTADVVVADRGS